LKICVFAEQEAQIVRVTLPLWICNLYEHLQNSIYTRATQRTETQDEQKQDENKNEGCCIHPKMHLWLATESQVQPGMGALASDTSLAARARAAIFRLPHLDLLQEDFGTAVVVFSTLAISCFHLPRDRVCLLVKVATAFLDVAGLFLTIQGQAPRLFEFPGHVARRVAAIVVIAKTISPGHNAVIFPVRGWRLIPPR
jgi:hypothetical protein